MQLYNKKENKRTAVGLDTEAKDKLKCKQTIHLKTFNFNSMFHFKKEDKELKFRE